MTKPSIDKATPEKLWIHETSIKRNWGYIYDSEFDAEPDDICYVRQDIADERVRVARQEVWDEAIKAVEWAFHNKVDILDYVRLAARAGETKCQTS